MTRRSIWPCWREGSTSSRGRSRTTPTGRRCKSWNAVYDLLTGHGFSKKPVLEGAGGAAGEAYAWAIANPDKVSCIYAENPVLRCTMTKAQPLDNLAALAKAGVPVLHVCGSLDPMYASQTREAEKRYKELGGSMTVIVQEGRRTLPDGAEGPEAGRGFHRRPARVTSDQRKARARPSPGLARRADDDQREAAAGQPLAEDLGKPRVEIVRADGDGGLHADGPGDPFDVERRRRPAEGVARLSGVGLEPRGHRRPVVQHNHQDVAAVVDRVGDGRHRRVEERGIAEERDRTLGGPSGQYASELTRSPKLRVNSFCQTPSCVLGAIDQVSTLPS